MTTLSEQQCWPLIGIPLIGRRYVLTEDTLEYQKGIVSPVTTSIRLSQVRGVATTQSRLQKLWGLRTVHVATDDPVVSELVIRNIRNGHLFEERLLRCVEESQSTQPHAV